MKCCDIEIDNTNILAAEAHSAIFFFCRKPNLLYLGIHGGSFR